MSPNIGLYLLDSLLCLRSRFLSCKQLTKILSKLANALKKSSSMSHLLSEQTLETRCCPWIHKQTAGRPAEKGFDEYAEKNPAFISNHGGST
jgi:hypothetical protein